MLLQAVGSGYRKEEAKYKLSEGEGYGTDADGKVIGDSSISPFPLGTPSGEIHKTGSIRTSSLNGNAGTIAETHNNHYEHWSRITANVSNS